MSYALMLKPRWPGSFRRSLCDEAGQVVRTLVFEEDKPLIVSDDEFAVLHDDVGKALVYAQRDADGNAIPKVDQFDDESGPVVPGREPTFYRSDLPDDEFAEGDTSDTAQQTDESDIAGDTANDSPAPRPKRQRKPKPNESGE